ncbi:MAG: class I SAM-dependent methyltransferase [Desulfosarcina sp.]|nr:class I SAM-dependent methyltransferase [Desulfobacterales bacterium]
MAWKPPQWFGDRKRSAQLDRHVDQSHVAQFGYRQMPTPEKVDWVRRHFNRVAPRYDFMNTLLSFGIQYVWKREAIRMMGLAPGDRILDVCGGTADLAIMAADRIGPRGVVVVYDINWAMIQAGVPKLTGKSGAGCIRFVQGDAEKIAFGDNTFDAVMVGFGIRNVTHMQQGFREMYRVLKPGGRFLCLEFSKPVNPLFRRLYDVYSFYVMPFLGRVLAGSAESYACLPETIRLFHLPDEINAILEAIGFGDVRYRRITNGIAVAHIGRKAH